MTASSFPVLSALIFFPLAASLALLMVKGEEAVRRLTLAAGLAEIALALPLASFDLASGGFQFVEKASWVPQWGLTYHLGIDGISLLMILLTVALLPLCVLCSWHYISRRIKEFHIVLLLMTSACVGVFAALDFVLFYLFWEAMLVPMYLLIAVWGGPNKRYASIKFFLYTLAGSTLLLVAIIAFYSAGGTFSIPELMTKTFSPRLQFWAFLAMVLAFAIKCPMFPFHTWLPAAHVEAPTAGSVLLASVLLKMGTYGFLRFCMPLTPDACVTFAPLMIALSLASILYGGIIALGQKDMKKLIAYSSVGHMGFVTLGIFIAFALVRDAGNTEAARLGMQGAMVQMISHGFVSGAMFTCVGVLYDRLHTRMIRDYGGVANVMPWFAAFFVLFSMANSGLPGTSGFVGEFMVVVASFQAHPLIAFTAALTLIIGASYSLWLVKRIFYGEVGNAHVASLKDIVGREALVLGVFAAGVLLIGVWPRPLTALMEPSIAQLAQLLAATKL